MAQDTLEIVTSKIKLFTLCSTSRNVGDKADKKPLLHLHDMIKVLQEKGNDTLTIVSKTEWLGNLPICMYEQLHNQIQKTQEEMNILKATIATQNEVIADLSAISSELEVCMKWLDWQHDVAFYQAIPADQENCTQTILWKLLMKLSADAESSMISALSVLLTAFTFCLWIMTSVNEGTV